jgi:hypothetical protein
MKPVLKLKQDCLMGRIFWAAPYTSVKDLAPTGPFSFVQNADASA